MSLPPSSPSSRHFMPQSPTSPSYTDHQFKRTLLDDVKNWSETRVAEWLSSQMLSRFSNKLIEHNISGAVLLDLDYESLKAMDIKTVGERVRLLTAIKALRQECYLAASLAARTPLRNNVFSNTEKHEGYNTTEAKPSKSSETNGAKGLLSRSNSFSRFLGRSESKRSQRQNNTQLTIQPPPGALPPPPTPLTSTSTSTKDTKMSSDQSSILPIPPPPLSPSSIQPSIDALPDTSLQKGGIMSMEKVKQTCVKVFGEDGQTRIVNVHTANEAKQVMAKVLHKFGIDESNADSYCIFVGSSTNGEARALSDAELVEICRSADRPEKERLILRKRHMFLTHEQFKRKGTINPSRRPLYQQWQQDESHTTIRSDSYRHLNQSASPLSLHPHRAQPIHQPRTLPSNGSNVSLTGSLRNNSIMTNNSSNRRRFFGERPPSEIISNNLSSFFPNHNREVLETAGIKAQRLSISRRNSALSRLEPRTYRNSVLPELVSVLGVDLDKFLEEEEGIEEDDLVFIHSPSGSSITTSSSSSDSEDEEDQFRANEEEEQLPALDPTAKVIEEEGREEGEEQQQEEDNSGSCISSDDDNEEMIAEKQSIKIDTPITTNVQEKLKKETDNASMLEAEPTEHQLPDIRAFSQKRTSSLPFKGTLKIDDTKQLPADPPVGMKPKQLPDTWMKGSLIGRGTFGDVYLGLNPISGELMAVKQVELPVENSATEERKKSMIKSLQREIELLQDLKHENIVQYWGSKTDESYFSIFLEYVPGGSVAGLLSSYGAFQEPLVNSFVRQILKGLNYLHNKDIVHRDIKGANVLVDNKGGVKITDFGISKKVEEEMRNSIVAAAHRPSLQGSIYWMAPEVVKQTRYTRKADIWSLGCLVVEMFTGDHPFPEYSQMQAIFQIGCATSPNIPPNISEEAQDFLRCTFKQNHKERPSAEELLKHPFLFEEPLSEDE
ncbi:hypothetical protein BD560DRAFT_490371 [Blakeslea trispora]|nr:hypothetical protein BD560DRAFT_490371 [Blakeslea trispora]